MNCFDLPVSFIFRTRGISAEVGSVSEGDSIRCIMANVTWQCFFPGSPEIILIGGPVDVRSLVIFIVVMSF